MRSCSRHVPCARARALAGRLPSFPGEDGVAVAVTLMVLVIGFALASVGSVAAMSSMRNASRDSEDKRAFAVAEAGVEQALLRQNKILTTDAFPCLVLGATQELIPGYPNGNGWCPEQTGQVEGGTYTYTVKPPTLIGTLQNQRRISIISEGTVGGTTRRIRTDALASTGTPAFADATVVGLDQFDVNGEGQIAADAGTNSDIYLDGNAEICGNAQHGVGRSIIATSNAGLCSGFNVTEGTIALSPPDPGNSWDSNDNGRFFSQDTKAGNVQWDPNTRTLTMSGNSALTLGGSTYSFCKLNMDGNSNLLIASGAVVRIYFDSPERCGLSAGTAQLSMQGNSEISVTSGDAADAGLLFVGSSTIPTTVQLAGNGKANELMLYAPLSDVQVSGNGNYTGAIAGKTFVDTGNGTISGHSSVLDFEVGVQTAYERERFVECVGPLTTSDPTQGC